MRKICKCFLFITLVAYSVSAQKTENQSVLDKMYYDMLKSIPASQRAILDSAYVKSQKENSALSGGSTQRGGIDANMSKDKAAVLPDAVNSDLVRMMQQIDTMRNRRMIHFKSANPLTE